MADNVTLNTMTGGDVVAADDIGGVKHQLVKIEYGAADSATQVSTTNPLPVSLANTGANATAVKVDGSAVTQPISIASTVTVDSELTTADLDTGAGTDTRAVVGLVGSKSGGGVLIPGDATKGLAVDLTATGQNTTALKVDASATTQPISAASLPLPTGAATAAKQPSLGTAGAASTDVISVQGIASMTALKVDGSAVTQPVSISGNQAVNNAQINGVTPLMGNGVTGTGSQRVTVASDNTPFAVKTDQTTHGTTDLVAADNTKIAGNAISAGNGVSGTGVQRVTIASDSTGNIATIGTSVTPGTAAANLGKAEDAAHTTGDTGVMALGVRETTLTDLSTNNADGDYEPFQVNKSGALWVTGAPSGNSGWSIATGSIAATKTDIGTANTAGNVGGWYIYNANASVAYVQFFNAQASAVTLGTTTPVYSLGIPASSAANVAPGMVGLSHSTAISIAVTTTRAGSTGPGSTVDYNIWYKQ